MWPGGIYLAVADVIGISVEKMAGSTVAVVERLEGTAVLNGPLNSRGVAGSIAGVLGVALRGQVELGFGSQSRLLSPLLRARLQNVTSRGGWPDA